VFRKSPTGQHADAPARRERVVAVVEVVAHDANRVQVLEQALHERGLVREVLVADLVHARVVRDVVVDALQVARDRELRERLAHRVGPARVAVRAVLHGAPVVARAEVVVDVERGHARGGQAHVQRRGRLQISTETRIAYRQKN